ncbi:hypothetical protein LTS08_008330 [Lithohypha guttulata]|nr:hypothetical protein LTS08_008330 [Lithohypha guttulata]
MLPPTPTEEVCAWWNWGQHNRKLSLFWTLIVFPYGEPAKDHDGKSLYEIWEDKGPLSGLLEEFQAHGLDTNELCRESETPLTLVAFLAKLWWTDP